LHVRSVSEKHRTKHPAEPAMRQGWVWWIAYNRTKLAFLRSVLPRDWNVEGAGVFASSECRFSAALATDLIVLEELPFWLRNQRQSNAKQVINVAMATKAIRKYEDTAPDAAVAHKQRIQQN